MKRRNHCWWFLLGLILALRSYGDETAIDYFDKGRNFESKGDFNDAITNFDKVIELKPNAAEGYGERGNVKAAQGDLDSAITDYTRAIELEPKESLGYYNRGSAKYEKSDWDGAIADFNEGIARNPKHTNAYYKRGLAEVNKGDLNGAILDEGKAIELDPFFAEAYLARASARKNQGDLSGANADYIKAGKLIPHSDWTGINLVDRKDGLSQELNRSSVQVDGEIKVIFKIRNASFSYFVLPAIEGLTVDSEDNSVLSDYNDGINYQVEVKTYTLAATRVGDFTIPSFDITTSEGRVLHTEPMIIHVVDGDQTPKSMQRTVAPASHAASPAASRDGPD